MNAPTPAPSIPNFEKRIAQFVQLRDKIEEMVKADKEKLAPFVELKKKLEAVLLDHLNQTNQDSASTAAGTVYRTERKTASIADGDAFRRHVIGADDWDLLDWKCNAVAANDFIVANGAPPPGINYSVTYTVGVRRK
jgi:hypothetical protein